MGKNSKNSEEKTLSIKKLFRKKGWVKRQRQMELTKNTQVIHDAENKSTDPQNSVELQPVLINSKIMHYFHQIEEEQTDHNEKEMETYDEEGIHNEAIENVKDKGLISINIANKNIEATEEYKEEDTSNETIEYCEDNKNLSFINIDNIDNIENVEDCEEKSTYNQSIEYSKDKKEIINSNCSVNGCNIPEKIPLGRCIINFSFFLNELHNVFDNHARGIDCQFEYWKFINYRRRGLLTQFFFKCEMCHYEANIWSEPIEKTLDLNAAVVSKSVAAGIGYSQLRQLFASMDIVCMSDKTYRKYRENLVTIQKDVMKNTKNEFILNEN